MKLILVMAMTADGKIARHGDHFPDWTGKADKRMFKKITTEAGVVIMGARTFDTIGKPLPGRLNVVITRSPERYPPYDNLVCTSDPPETILAKLSDQGYQTAILSGGAMINSLFLRARLIDEMMVTVIPIMFGQGLSMFSEPMHMALELLTAREIDPGVLVLHYRFVYDRLV
ncbi:MAG: dihydrofolate reductase [Desulfobacteraceae bacterium]|nr:MAG: dihydrofolate reductase [Desulfobacteraceae bacterium]